MSVLFVCFVALRPKSTAKVMEGRSVHLTTHFSWASLNKPLTSNLCTYFCCNSQQPFLNDSAERRRMTAEIISWWISMKVWDLPLIELATHGSAIRLASVARHITDCPTQPGLLWVWGWDRKIHPGDHHLASRGMPSDDKCLSRGKDSFSCSSFTVYFKISFQMNLNMLRCNNTWWCHFDLTLTLLDDRVR